MNNFTDPILRNTLPQRLESTLDDGSGNRVTCLGFNRKGRYLAAGHHDGRCTVWNFETRSVEKVLIGHVRPITSVSWSRSGRYLVTASLDWNIRVWDITTSGFYYSQTFQSMVFSAVFHPSESLLLVTLWMDSPHLINLETKDDLILQNENSRDDENSTQFTANWNVKGDMIYLGGNDGSLIILNTTTTNVIHAFSIDSGESHGKPIGIKSIAFSSDGNQYLLNCMDRAIRLYNVADNSFSVKLNQTVDSLQWKACHFYGDEYVIGCSSEISIQKIYIWSRHFGHLMNILEGPKPTILDLKFHPLLPLFVLSATDGTIVIWGKHHSESWSAYAPGFTELEENEEYIEREDEFDEIPDIPIITDKQEDFNEEIVIESEPEEEDYFFPVNITQDSSASSTQPNSLPFKSKRKQKI